MVQDMVLVMVMGLLPLKLPLPMVKEIQLEHLVIEHLNMEETHLMVEVKEDLSAKLLVKEEW